MHEVHGDSLDMGPGMYHPSISFSEKELPEFVANGWPVGSDYFLLVHVNLAERSKPEGAMHERARFEILKVGSLDELDTKDFEKVIAKAKEGGEHA